MSLRCLHGLALLIFAFSISAHAQSLGDIARQYRAERQQSGAHHSPVITNDDIESSKPASPAKKQVATEDAINSTGAEAEAQPSTDAKPTTGVKKENHKSETDIRTEEINNRYLGRIATIRKDLTAAQQELARLQQEQAETVLAYRRSLYTFPNPEVYENQQRSFNEQIKTQSDLVISLTSQLEDAQEAARHAGVPHATD